MLKKLTMWALFLVLAVQVWKMPDFQQFKDETIAGVWDLASEKSHKKELTQVSEFASRIKYWMENFDDQEKEYIKQVTESQSNFEQFVQNYCREAKPFHPVLSNAHLLLACDKAKQSLQARPN